MGKVKTLTPPAPTLAVSPLKRHLQLTVRALILVLPLGQLGPLAQQLVRPMIGKVETNLLAMPDEELIRRTNCFEQILLAVQNEDLSDERFIDILTEQIALAQATDTPERA